MTNTETKQLQGSTMDEMIDRLAAINATADYNGGLKQDDLREHHNIIDEIRRRKLRTRMEAMSAISATIWRMARAGMSTSNEYAPFAARAPL
ncbi:MAG: hypothetical protein NTV94_05055 [Planctomycetota bacterium]|nr:hypothetical protein [Planctomycetota bacterium]